MCGVHYSIMRTTHPDLVCLLFVPSLYSTFSFTCIIGSYGGYNIILMGKFGLHLVG